VLQVHVVVHDQVSLGDASLAEETARWLEEGTAQYARAEQEGVRIKFSAARLGASIPEDLEGDEALDSWLADHCPSSAADGGDGAETFAVFLLPERAGGAGGAAIAVRGDGAHVLTMGVGMHGWLAVPATVAGSTDALRAWLDWLPLAVASVVCGERAEVACPARASSARPARACRTERSALPGPSRRRRRWWRGKRRARASLARTAARSARMSPPPAPPRPAPPRPAPPRPAPPRPAPRARGAGRRGRAQGPGAGAGRRGRFSANGRAGGRLAGRRARGGGATCRRCGWRSACSSVTPRRAARSATSRARPARCSGRWPAASARCTTSASSRKSGPAPPSPPLPSALPSALLAAPGAAPPASSFPCPAHLPAPRDCRPPGTGRARATVRAGGADRARAPDDTTRLCTLRTWRSPRPGTRRTPRPAPPLQSPHCCCCCCCYYFRHHCVPLVVRRGERAERGGLHTRLLHPLRLHQRQGRPRPSSGARCSSAAVVFPPQPLSSLRGG